MAVASKMQGGTTSHRPAMTWTRGMSVLRFLMHMVLASWVAVTAVAVATAPPVWVQFVTAIQFGNQEE